MKNNQRRFETLTRLTRRLHQSLFARPRRQSAARAQQQRFQPANCQIETLEDRRLLTAAFSELHNPNPSDNSDFGDSVVTLSTGNIVVTDPNYDGWRGAVYLFDGQTGDLISTLTGDTRHERVGIGGITALPNGNFVVSSPKWSGGNMGSEVGAATLVNGVTGLNGVISTANSLVGSSEDDGYGGGRILVLENGNYVVTNPGWDYGEISNVGAVTFGDATTGVTGVISAANSLIGASEHDRIGHHYGNDTGIKLLANGNYLVGSPFWDNGSSEDAGALTWGNGTTGTVGIVSSANSLVGSTTDDFVGDFTNGDVNITLLANGNYVLTSPTWDNGTVTDAGAVTFGDGTTGVAGEISSANSLVGTTAGDKVGALYYLTSSVTELANGNYVVSSPTWDNGTVVDAGAVTFGSGTTGVSGVISATNSLVGVTKNDRLGRNGLNTNGVTPLSNGNYVVSSPGWNNGSIAGAGAATFGDGTTGISGVITADNSLVGTTKNDLVGYAGVTALTNGNYVVSSPAWSDDFELAVGAVTFGNGTTGITGAISSANSLVGSGGADNVGRGGVVALPNGNYVAVSNYWSRKKGAVTFGNGTTGITGILSAENSLVGTRDLSYVGMDGVTVLANGNYVVVSTEWANAENYDLGAVTWGSGTAGVQGVVSAANSLVGTKRGDHIGSDGVVALTNGNYVVSSSGWDNGAIIDAGAVTFGNGTTGSSGQVSSTNSLVGSTTDDQLGYHYYSGHSVTALANGNYVVVSTEWDHGSIVDAGAVTFGDGTTGISGEITSDNSLVGAHEDDQVGDHRAGVSGVTALPNGNYLVTSAYWDNGSIDEGGGVTFADGTTGVTGFLTSSNSVASELGDSFLIKLVRDDVNQSFLVAYEEEDTIWVGSQVDGFRGTTFDLIEDVVVSEHDPEETIDLSGLEPVTEGPVIWSATSDNPDVIPDSGLTVLDEGGRPRLRVSPLTGRTGTAEITVQVEDGGLDHDLTTPEDNGTFQRSFVFTINAIEESTEETLALRVVETPTDVDANGEAAALPGNATWIGEWTEYWVEIWVQTENLSSAGVALVGLELEYQTAATSATEIQFGPAFTQNQSGTIDDVNGVISQLAAVTETVDLGVDKQLLFARIKFEALVQDELALDLAGHSLSSETLSFEITSSLVGLGTGHVVEPLNIEHAQTEIWANPYDLNDDGQISFQDLLRFASVYGAVPSESGSDYAWLADLNQDGRVNFRDLVLFAGNYGKNKLQKVRPTPVHYPDNYPYGWNQQLQAASQPVVVSTAASLTQSKADVMRESAVEELSPRLSSTEQQKLEEVQVEVVDLAGTTLGQVVGDTIYLDVNAAGHGWFIDDTPRDHSEFQADSSLSLIALPGSEAAGLIDLWTVIRHELGHLLGDEHAEEGIMDSVLAPGERKLPDWNAETDDFFASLNADSELLAF
ncbi:hypothetical protein [Gimesia sp.]|uniref:hypothetical protein n=1 Tax=Gimesia sp. TaxID=2024833 RepID=UPI0032EE618B